MKFKTMVSKIKYELIIFSLLLTQAGFQINWKHPVRTDFLTLYLLDFKVGRGSRMLIGSVVDLLCGNVLTERWLTGFILASFALTYLAAALLLGKLIRSTGGELKTATLLLTALFIFTSFSVRVFIQYIGLLDIYWFLITLAIIAAMRNRAARWLVPFLCILGLATHYGFAMTFMPFVLGLLVYETVRTDRKKGSAVLLPAGFLTMISASVYFGVYANKFIKMGSESAWKYLSGKAAFPVWRFYYEGYLYYSDLNTGKKYSSITDVIKVLITYASVYCRIMNFVTSLLFLLPLLALFFFIWRNAMKVSKGKAEKAFMLFCMALPLPVLPAFVISTDMERFLGEIIIVQFMMLFWLIYNRNEAVLSSLIKAAGFFKKNPLLLVLLLIFSFSAFIIK